MSRFASLYCCLLFAAGCGTSDPQPRGTTPDSSGSLSDVQTVRIHISGFKKSKSGAT